MRINWLLALPILIAAPGIAEAEKYGDPVRGQIYAKETCSECHGLTSADLLSPVAEATHFVTLANTPGMTGTALAVWLQTPHPSMPNFVIEPKDRDDVIAYIVSLKSD